MALNLLRSVIFFLLVSIVTTSDPDITKDYIVPKNFAAINRNFFTYAGPHGIWDGDCPPNFKVTKASMTKFPALNGLMHYQYNAKADQSATTISAFGSANTGTVSVPTTIFTTGIDDNILAKGFKTNVATRLV
ncbi:putative germin-like protein 9-2 [Actinidia eriantha]|uniref:putative germin-like protein 9-2 n=1 Tax=Actinidia eriantha TaxID=165200 RepID=UPI002587BF78|nr:putative germin-like protein 9-2 [Actinidia eriantha]